VRILGVDPGLQRTGYGCVELSDRGRIALIEGGVIRTDAEAPIEARLKELCDGLRDVCAEFAPDTVVIEELYAHYNHPRTAVIMGHARGVVMLAAAERDVPVVSYAATRVKKSLTGYGRASKEQMQSAVQAKLKLEAALEPNDVADAIAVALCHADAQQHIVDVTRAAS